MIGSVPLTSADSTSYGPPKLLPGANVLQLTVNNGAVNVQLGEGVVAQLWTPADGSFRLPGVHTIPSRCDAIRVASAVEHAGNADDPWPTYAVDAY